MNSNKTTLDALTRAQEAIRDVVHATQPSREVKDRCELAAAHLRAAANICEARDDNRPPDPSDEIEHVHQSTLSGLRLGNGL